MTALNRDSLQANLPAGMIVDITSSDVQGLEHFGVGEAMVVGHSGGQTLLNFGYGKPVSYPTACCVACPWRTWYDNDEESDGDGASLSGDEKASLGEETNFAEKLAPPSPVLPVSAPPAPSMALTSSPPPVAPPAPLYPALPVPALPVPRILALEIAWFA